MQDKQSYENLKAFTPEYTQPDAVLQVYAKFYFTL